MGTTDLCLFVWHGTAQVHTASPTVAAEAVPVPEGLRIEADLSTLAFQLEDAREGMDAFMNKRKPAFKDR